VLTAKRIGRTGVQSSRTRAPEVATHSDGRAEDDVGEGAAAAELTRTGIWAAPPRHQPAAERMPKSRNTAVPPPLIGQERLRARETLRGSVSPGQELGPPHQQTQQRSSATQVAHLSHRSTQFSVRKNPMTCGAPLRNRTVDLLLTIS